MKQENLPPLYSIEMLFLTFFGTGKSPYAPGTVASAATLPFLWLFANSGMPTVFLAPMLFLLIGGTGFLIEIFQKKYTIHDPGWIVIDEVIGMMCGFLFWPSSSLIDLLLLFILFRIFDISKLWPVSFFDKQVRHGIGVVLDDVMAGIYAGAILYIGHTYLVDLF